MCETVHLRIARNNKNDAKVEDTEKRDSSSRASPSSPDKPAAVPNEETTVPRATRAVSKGSPAYANRNKSKSKKKHNISSNCSKRGR